MQPPEASAPHGARAPQPSCQVAESEAFPRGQAFTPDVVRDQSGLQHIAQIVAGARDPFLRQLAKRMAGSGSPKAA